MQPDELIALAEEALLQGHTHAACEFLEVARTINPKHPDVLESYGEILLHHCGEPDRARQFLEMAVDAAPNKGHIKFLNLAQLSTGWEAHAYYNKALELVSTLHPGEEKDGLDRTKADIYAAIAELFMTDLCDDPNAEQLCEEALAQGALAHQNVIAVHQTLGCLRLVQQRDKEAATELRCAVELVYTSDEIHLPGVQSMLELGSMLREIDPSEAFEFLLHVLHFDSENPYAWFITAEAARLGGFHHDSARLYKHTHSMVLANASDDSFLREVDKGIRQLVEEMGGEEELSNVPHMDDPNPLQYIESRNPSD